jgi:hypothetical protein
VFCTIVVVIALVVTWFGLRVDAPPAPAKPAVQLQADRRPRTAGIDAAVER